MKTKKAEGKLMPKYNLELLFENANGTVFRPEHVFLAYLGDLPCAYCLQRFNKAQVSKWLKTKHSHRIARIIKQEVIYARGKVTDDGMIFVMKNQLLVCMDGITTRILYCDASENAAKELVKELLPLEWEENDIIAINALLQGNFD